ncbi:MAG: HlyD family efflux transporter periplasmic adaptor subunit [Gammaproteobacteria bacterium]
MRPDKDESTNNEDQPRRFSESLNSVLAKLPEPLRLRLEAARASFLAAQKSTQYLILGGASVLVIALFMTVGNDDGASNQALTFTARRGDLDITVLEGGGLEALQSQEIRSRVKGREGVKILSIIEEGYRVTQEDVESSLVLVELDTAALIDEKLNQEIAVETAEASYIEQKAQYEIQLNQNMTELNDARQEMRFARLDFEKFLGANIVGDIVGKLEIEERLAKAEVAQLANQAAPLPVASLETAPSEPVQLDIESLPPPMQDRIRQMMAENNGELPAEMLERMRRFAEGGFQPGQNRGGRIGRGPGTESSDNPADGLRPTENLPTTELADNPAEPETLTLEPLNEAPVEQWSTLLMDDTYMAIRDGIDFTQYADIEQLEDGEAKQQLRALLDELQVAQEEYLLAQDRIEGQRRLEARGFITPTELEAEELNMSKAFNKQQEKETALALYIQYTFPKEAEQKLSDYENAVMGFQRQLIDNIAEEAQQRARFRSAERKFNLERVKLADVNDQIEMATIHAQRPGLVVYGASDQSSQRYRRSNEEAIAEGATVRERQAILTIPDMREMAVKVNIHESAVQRVAVGQTANVSIDAFPDERLTGVVTKVAVVADSANSFMNPDLKVYPTTVKINGEHDWLRPGMSAEVEILVDRLEDVVYVPLQAVSYFDDKRVVYISRGGNPVMREVETGRFSESFIEIRSGLSEGEEVLLLAPQQQMNERAANQS